MTPDDLLRRPFARPAHTARDLRALRRMLSRVRELLARPHSADHPCTVRDPEPDGRAHQTVLARPDEMLHRDDMVVVGYFGQMRPDTPVADRIWQADAALIAEFPEYPGLLCYSTLLLPDGDWGDLALFTDIPGMHDWGQSRIHSAAVNGLAPRHYRSVRMHFGTLHGRLSDQPTLEMTETLYIDYTASPPERARIRRDALPVRLR